MAPNPEQHNVNELFKKVNANKEMINALMMKHGHCIRLFVSKENDTWLFQDGYKHVVPKQGVAI